MAERPLEPPAPPRPPLSGKQKAGALAMAIAAILGGVYAHEGGYVNDPADPGGETNYGITAKTAHEAGYQGSMRAFQKHCSERHAICADAIYQRQYLERPGFMPMVSIEPAVADELVDSGVNLGPRWPSLWFQQVLDEQAGAHLAIDGQIGPSSIAAYRAFQAQRGKIQACRIMLDGLDGKQAARYAQLVRANPRLKKFYRGWIRYRIGNVDRRDCGKGWE